MSTVTSCCSLGVYLWLAAVCGISTTLPTDSSVSHISRLNFQTQRLCRRDTQRKATILKIDNQWVSSYVMVCVSACMCLCFVGGWGPDSPMYGVMWLDSITVNLVLLLSSCHCMKTNNHHPVQLSRQRKLLDMFCACLCWVKSITATSTWSVPLLSCWWMTSKKYFACAESLFDGKPAPQYTNSKLKRAKSWRCEGFTSYYQKYLHRTLHNKAVSSSEVWHELNKSLNFPHFSCKLKKS